LSNGLRFAFKTLFTKAFVETRLLDIQNILNVWIDILAGYPWIGVTPDIAKLRLLRQRGLTGNASQRA
jgi:hypothetical protein